MVDEFLPCTNPANNNPSVPQSSYSVKFIQHQLTFTATATSLKPVDPVINMKLNRSGCALKKVVDLG